MLTRLKVSGFKNLVDVDVHFGTFTCIAGVNGVGKSNLFDAIRFLSALADMSLIEAAQSVRDEDERSADIRNLFHKIGQTYEPEMHFETEMIIPPKGIDDLGQTAEATITFLKYAISIAYRVDEKSASLGSLVITKEELVHINLGDAKKHLNFPHKPEWRKSVVHGRRTSEFISTDDEDGETIIRLHQDGSSGKPRTFLAAKLPRTVISSTYAAESPTALLAKKEMQSWRLLQLEPSALRRPDKFTDEGRLGADGSHLPSTIERLVRQSNEVSGIEEARKTILVRIANRLSELIDDVGELSIDRDEGRQRFTLYLRQKDGSTHPAYSLSDGTLRFLALAVLGMDTEAQGVICLEEPENGIHPARIPAMLQLLEDLAMDTDEALASDNPLRQVIINTHSPKVVENVPDDSLLVAKLVEAVENGQRYQRVIFGALPETWRTELENAEIISLNDVLAYLDPQFESKNTGLSTDTTKRVKDRNDIMKQLSYWGMVSE